MHLLNKTDNGTIMLLINHPSKSSVISSHTRNNTSSTILGGYKSSKHTTIHPYRCRVHASKTYNHHINISTPPSQWTTTIRNNSFLCRFHPCINIASQLYTPQRLREPQHHNLFANLSSPKKFRFISNFRIRCNTFTTTHEHMSYHIPNTSRHPQRHRRRSYLQRPCPSVREPITLSGQGGFLLLISRKVIKPIISLISFCFCSWVGFLDFISFYIRLIFIDVIDAFEHLRSNECCPTGPCEWWATFCTLYACIGKGF